MSDESKTIVAMLELMHKNRDALNMLSAIRVNPKIGKNHLRFDLEFYLPQILAHYYRSDLTASEENQVRAFILKACSTN